MPSEQGHSGTKVVGESAEGIGFFSSVIQICPFNVIRGWRKLGLAKSLSKR